MSRSMEALIVRKDRLQLTVIERDATSRTEAVLAASIQIEPSCKPVDKRPL